MGLGGKTKPKPKVTHFRSVYSLAHFIHVTAYFRQLPAAPLALILCIV